MPTVLLDESRRPRAARQGLQPDRAAAREEVEEVAAREFGRQDVEQRLAHAILRRTNRVRLRHLKIAPAKFSACNSHFSRGV